MKKAIPLFLLLLFSQGVFSQKARFSIDRECLNTSNKKRIQEQTLFWNFESDIYAYRSLPISDQRPDQRPHLVGRYNLQSREDTTESIESSVFENHYGSATWTGAEGENLWAFGGSNQASSLYHNDLWKYNLEAGSWSQVNADLLPSARSKANTWENQEYIWLWGGVGLENRYKQIQYFDDLWRWSKTDETWQLLESGDRAVLPIPRIMAATWIDTLNQTLYLYGGEASDAMSDLWSYSILDNTWLNIAENNEPYIKKISSFDRLASEERISLHPGFRSGAQTWFTEGKLWLWGGYKLAGNTDPLIWIYDVSTHLWKDIIGRDYPDVSPYQKAVSIDSEQVVFFRSLETDGQCPARLTLELNEPER